MEQEDAKHLVIRGHLYAHISAMGLEGRLNVAAAERNLWVYDTETDPDRGVPIGATAMQLLLGAGLGAVGALDWPTETADAIQKLRETTGTTLTAQLQAVHDQRGSSGSLSSRGSGTNEEKLSGQGQGSGAE